MADPALDPLAAIDQQKQQAQQQQLRTQQQQPTQELDPLAAIDARKQTQQQPETLAQGGGESWPYRAWNYLTDPNAPPASWLNTVVGWGQGGGPITGPKNDVMPLPHQWSDITAPFSDLHGLAANVNRGVGLGFVDPDAANVALLDVLRTNGGRKSEIPGSTFADKYHYLAGQNEAARTKYAQAYPSTAEMGEIAGNFLGSAPIMPLTELAAARTAMPAVRYAVPAVVGGHEGYVSTPANAPPGEKLANTLAGAAMAAGAQGATDVGAGLGARMLFPANRPIAPSGPIVGPLVTGALKSGAGYVLNDPRIAPHLPIPEGFAKEYGLVKLLGSGLQDLRTGAGNALARARNWWEATAPTGPPVRGAGGQFVRGRPIYQPFATVAGLPAGYQAAQQTANSPLADILAEHLPNWDPATLAGYGD
jgi:hypothetical protein